MFPTNIPAVLLDLITDYYCSGEMPQFILLPLVPSLVPQMFTISVTLVTDTPRFSTVRPMLPPDSFLDQSSLRRQLPIQRRQKKRTTTGNIGMPRRRMEWGAGVDAILIFWILKASQEVVFLSG